MGDYRTIKYYGLLLNTGYSNSIHITHQRLLNAGYELFPSHAESKNQLDEEWLRPINKDKLFPRFHIMKDKKEWLIHYDYFVGTEKRTTKKKTPQLLAEINRLKNTSRKLKLKLYEQDKR